MQGRTLGQQVTVPLIIAMVLITVMLHLTFDEVEPAVDEGRTVVYNTGGAKCDTSEQCSLNGVCIKGVCHCSAGFGGMRCERCAAAYQGYPSCKPDGTCYAISWERCKADGSKLFQNEGLLPGRPKRAVSLVGSAAKAQKAVLGVQVVQGLWGSDTVSLKLCWLRTCGRRHSTGTRSCKWENATSMQIYIKNSGCSVDVARKPTRAVRHGAGFKGECDDPSIKKQPICTFPSKRHSVYTREVSWYMEKDEHGNLFFESANWRGHYIKGEGSKPTITNGRPDPGSDGFMRFSPLLDPHPDYCSNITR